MKEDKNNKPKEEIGNLNIYQRMSLITNKIQPVAKKLKVGEGTNKEYKAASEKDILNAVKPIEYECGVYSFPFERKLLNEERVVFKNKYGETENFVIRLQTIYRFVNVDKPDEFVDITTYGDGVDSQDKAPGKAMTYADKYALMKAYKIATGDDPDKDKSQKLSKEAEELKLIYMGKFKQLVSETTVDYDELLNQFGVTSDVEMTIEQLKQGISLLKKIKTQNKEEVF